MMLESELARYPATVYTGPAIPRWGAEFWMVTSITPNAEAWLYAHFDGEATWIGATQVVEMTYFPGIADAINAAGFLVERNALPG